MSRLTYFFAPPMEDVLKELEAESYTQARDQERILRVIQYMIPATPWYIQILIAIGAWISAIFFFGVCGYFMVIALRDTSLSSLALMGIVAGLIFMGGAGILSDPKGGSLYFKQVALVFCIVGQLLFLTGVAFMRPSRELWCMVAFGLQVALLLFYPDVIQQFISSLGIIASLTALIFVTEFYYGLTLLTIVFALITLFIWLRYPFVDDNRTVRRLYRTLCYSMPISMILTMVIPLSNLTLEYDFDMHLYYHPTIIAVAQSILLLYLADRILRYYDIPLESFGARAVFASIVIIAVPSLWIPGILTAIIIGVLGFRYNNMIILAFSAIALTIFLGIFYYDLEATLQIKGNILVFTGITLLALWAVMTIMQFQGKKPNS